MSADRSSDPRGAQVGTLVRHSTLLAIAMLLLLPATAVADQRFTDPVGDVTGGLGPDIVAVTVSQPDSTKVAFATEFAMDPPLTADVARGSTDMLMLLIDPTMTSETSVYAAGVHGGNIADSVRDGAPLSVPKDGSSDLRWGVVGVAVSGKIVTLTIPLSALGSPSRLRFRIGAGQEGPGDATGGTDVHPASGWQSYDLTGSPPVDWPLVMFVTLVGFVALLAVVAFDVMRRRQRQAVGSANV